ncbi:MAG: NifB/NifX family molybdenum-iron cluster-binding protein, partial [Atribacterota bacterium]
MKIGITSQGKSLKDPIDPRFGRCQFFLIVDDESSEVEVVANPQLSAGGGAGIQSAQLMIDRGVKAVLTGNMGPNASKVFNEAGIKVFI